MVSKWATRWGLVTNRFPHVPFLPFWRSVQKKNSDQRTFTCFLFNFGENADITSNIPDLQRFQNGHVEALNHPLSVVSWCQQHFIKVHPVKNSGRWFPFLTHNIFFFKQGLLTEKKYIKKTRHFSIIQNPIFVGWFFCVLNIRFLLESDSFRFF